MAGMARKQASDPQLYGIRYFDGAAQTRKSGRSTGQSDFVLRGFTFLRSFLP